MNSGNPKVLWPKMLGLYAKLTGQCFAMRFLRDVEAKVSVDLKPDLQPDGTPVLSRIFSCSVIEAHYLSRVYVRPLDGGRIPEGKLLAFLDKELIFEDKVGAFIPDFDPVDCEKPYSWKSCPLAFTAHPLVPAKEAESDLKLKRLTEVNRQIGFMMPNGCLVEVYLNNMEVSEAVRLEVGILTALYTTKAEEAAAVV